MISVQPTTRALTPVGAILAVVDILFLLLIFLLIGGNYVGFSALDAQQDSSIIATGSFAEPVVLTLSRGGGLVLAGKRYSEAQAAEGLTSFFEGSTFDVLIVPESGVPAESLLLVLNKLNKLGQNTLVANPGQNATAMEQTP